MRALVSFDIDIPATGLNALQSAVAEAKAGGDNIRLAKVTPKIGGYTANVDLLIGRNLAKVLVGDYFSGSNLRVNSARSYKFTAKQFNAPKNSVTFKPADVIAVNPKK